MSCTLPVSAQLLIPYVDPDNAELVDDDLDGTGALKGPCYARGARVDCAKSDGLRATRDLDQMDLYALKTIHYTVDGLRVGGRIPRDDEQDIRQTLTLEYLRRKRSFNSARASYTTFISTVLASATRSVLRKQRKQSQKWIQLEFNFEASVPDPRAQPSLLDMAIAVQQVISALPEKLRLLAKSLSFESPTEFCRHHGGSRSAVYEDIARLRHVFEANGFCSTERRPVTRSLVAFSQRNVSDVAVNACR
jgi:DNA-directed RNA polymerase specialized sigma24 family protein